MIWCNFEAAVECIFYFLHSCSSLLIAHTYGSSCFIFHRPHNLNTKTCKWTSPEAEVDHSWPQKAQNMVRRQIAGHRRRGSRVCGQRRLRTMRFGASMSRKQSMTAIEEAFFTFPIRTMASCCSFAGLSSQRGTRRK